jgi:hypothetical protein
MGMVWRQAATAKNGVGNMKRILIMAVVAITSILTILVGAELDVGDRVTGEENDLLVNFFGTNEAVVVTNGYLFLDFDYVPGPYTIQRVGQGVSINGRLFSSLYRGPMPWTNSNAVLSTDFRVPVAQRNPKAVLDCVETFMTRLREYLSMNLAVFLSSSRKSPMTVPVAFQWPEVELRRALDVAFEEGTQEEKLAKLRSPRAWGDRANDPDRFLEKAKNLRALKDKLHAKGESLRGANE